MIVLLYMSQIFFNLKYFTDKSAELKICVTVSFDSALYMYFFSPYYRIDKILLSYRARKNL